MTEVNNNFSLDAVIKEKLSEFTKSVEYKECVTNTDWWTILIKKRHELSQKVICGKTVSEVDRIYLEGECLFRQEYNKWHFQCQ